MPAPARPTHPHPRSSEGAILDPRRVSDGPVATLCLPGNSGITFHGVWRDGSGQGSAAGELLLPAGLYIRDDRIYVADSYNRRVQVFQYLASQ